MNWTIGNTMGNLANGGLMAFDEDEAWIALPEGLLKLQGEEAELVYEGPCRLLNVTDEAVFFVDDRSRIVSIDRETNFPRVWVDRTGLRYDEINGLIVVGNWLFYSIYWGAGIYRIDLETGRERFVCQCTCTSLAADEEWLYYVDDDSGVIQRLPLQGIEALLMLSLTGLAEQWYEQHEIPTEDFALFLRKGMAEKIDLSLLIESEPLNQWESSYSIQPTDGLILYLACNTDEEEPGCYLHALNPTTGDEIQLVEESVDAFNTLEDWVLVRFSDTQLLHRLPKNGGEPRRVLGDPVEQIFTSGDQIWCTHPEGNRVSRFYVDGSGLKVFEIEKEEAVSEEEPPGGTNGE